MPYAQIRNASRAEVILVPATAQGEGEKIAFPEESIVQPAPAIQGPYSDPESRPGDSPVSKRYCHARPRADDKLPFGSIFVAKVCKAKLDREGAVINSSPWRRFKDKSALVAVV